MPKVTVDGQPIEVPDGATVLQACELAVTLVQNCEVRSLCGRPFQGLAA